MKKKIWLAVGIAAAVAALVLGALAAYGRYQMGRLPGLSFQEALAYSTKGREDAVITVGIVRSGEASYTVYGADGAVLPHETHTYEIGSLTKTFTAALVSRAAQEGLLDLDASIDHYLDLPAGNAYPTLRAILTHTAGYKPYYMETPMISNFFAGENSFRGVTKAMVLETAGSLSLPAAAYPFDYSNYGYAVLGLVLEAVYDCDYGALIAQFGLPDTHLSDGGGDLGRYWAWEDGDAYLSAGGLTSDIADMLAYAQMQLDGPAYVTACHAPQKDIDAASEDYQKLGIRMDAAGLSWMLDLENGIVWHNGGTGDYNCYLGFRPERGVAVVILSNLPPDTGIPATALGVKLLAELPGETAPEPPVEAVPEPPAEAAAPEEPAASVELPERPEPPVLEADFLENYCFQWSLPGEQLTYDNRPYEARPICFTVFRDGRWETVDVDFAAVKARWGIPEAAEFVTVSPDGANWAFRTVSGLTPPDHEGNQ